MKEINNLTKQIETFLSQQELIKERSTNCLFTLADIGKEYQELSKQNSNSHDLIAQQLGEKGLRVAQASLKIHKIRERRGDEHLKQLSHKQTTNLIQSKLDFTIERKINPFTWTSHAGKLIKLVKKMTGLNFLGKLSESELQLLLTSLKPSIDLLNTLYNKEKKESI